MYGWYWLGFVSPPCDVAHLTLVWSLWVIGVWPEVSERWNYLTYSFD